MFLSDIKDVDDDNEDIGFYLNNGSLIWYFENSFSTFEEVFYRWINKF